MRTNRFKLNPLKMCKTVCLNADFKEITFMPQLRKQLKSVDPLNILATELFNLLSYVVGTKKNRSY